MSDFKVRLKNNMDDIFYYPDVMVACGREGIEKYYLRNPKLVVEVLSPTTEATDRREKIVHCRRVATLEEYVLVAPDNHEVTLHRRGDDWEASVFTSPQDLVEFHSIGLSIPLAQIYDGVF
jgi:Uma2 family endonuclease